MHEPIAIGLLRGRGIGRQGSILPMDEFKVGGVGSDGHDNHFLVSLTNLTVQAFALPQRIAASTPKSQIRAESLSVACGFRKNPA